MSAEVLGFPSSRPRPCWHRRREDEGKKEGRVSRGERRRRHGADGRGEGGLGPGEGGREGGRGGKQTDEDEMNVCLLPSRRKKEGGRELRDKEHALKKAARQIKFLMGEEVREEQQQQQQPQQQ